MRTSQEICVDTIKTLSHFDESTSPFGLYSVDDYVLSMGWPRKRFPLWNYCLMPHYEGQGFSVRKKRYERGRYFFWSEELESVELCLVKISQIKVRKFGSRYRIDPRKDFSDRWEELKFDKQLRYLWKSRDHDYDKLKMLLFICFGREEFPFEEEFRELRKRVDWNKYGVRHLEHNWNDRYDRKFGVHLSIWWKESRSFSRPIGPG